METNLYFMLQTDSVASKLDKTTSYSNLHVSCGSIWVYHDDVIGASPQHRLRPQQSLGSNRNANSPMTLYSVEQQDVLLTCSPQDVSQIDEIEAQLLLAVPIAERLRLVTETTLLQEGRQIFQRWTDQFRPSHRNATSDIYVYVLGQKDLPEKAAGVVQYVGPLPSFSGTWFGVKLAPRYHGFGTTDGFFRGKQFFHSPADSSVFVAVNKICLCTDYLDFEETYDVVQHQGRPTPLAVADRNGDAGFSKGLSCEATDEDIPRPPLHIGERVVWISDDGPEPGTVKWIGVLPDCRVKEYTIGVEFDRPIGTGTGKYNNDQLFRTAQNHASLIPVLGLMKAEEFYGSKDAVPSSPFAAGWCKPVNEIS